MLGFLKRGFVLGLSVLVLTVFSNTYHANAHDECCSTENSNKCCMENECLDPCSEKLTLKNKEELLAMKVKLEKALEGKSKTELETCGMMLECLEIINKTLDDMKTESTKE